MIGALDPSNPLLRSAQVDQRCGWLEKMEAAERRTAILEYIEAQLGRLRMQADAIDAPLLAYMIEEAAEEARLCGGVLAPEDRSVMALVESDPIRLDYGLLELRRVDDPSKHRGVVCSTRLSS